MKTRILFALFVLALLLAPAVMFAQEHPAAVSGSVEVGGRYVTGDVYGRPDLPFSPSVTTSKFNEYRDLKNGFFLKSLNLKMDNILGSKNYFNLQSNSSFYKDQSYLATFGQYGRFKLQFRYDETPHTFSNTTRTLFTQGGAGVYTMPLSLKTALQNASATGTATAVSANLPALVNAQVPGMQFITPGIQRKMGSGLLSYNVTPNLNFNVGFSRENEVGTRPIGFLFNSGPSASSSSQPSATSNRQSPGTGVEVPEPVDYFTNTIKAGLEYGRNNWGVQFGYTGSLFENNIPSLLVDNPFATADLPVVIIPNGTGGCTASGQAVNCAVGAVPARGRMALYPDNSAHYLNFGGAFDLTKHVRVMGSVVPGWLRQNAPFLPYTENTAITSIPALPETSLHGNKQTLAMNYTVSTRIKSVELSAKYRHYDYNNNTPGEEFAPILGDTIPANPRATAQIIPGGDPAVTAGNGSPKETEPFGYNKKTLELTGNWAFSKHNSVKVGYEGEWMDRVHRDVDHSVEHSFVSALDLNPRKDITFRLSYRHQNRLADAYSDMEAEESGQSGLVRYIIPNDSPFARRFDQADRLRDTGTALLQYSPTQRLTLAASYTTTQDNFNRRGGSNSDTALNPPSGPGATWSPYYIYGLLKDISYNYTFSADYLLSNAVAVFAEYSRENYNRNMVSRSRSPNGLPTNLAPDCSLTSRACDSNNNDWTAASLDRVDVWSAGVDFNLGKRVWLTQYYSLAAGKGNMTATALGDPTVTGANKFVLTGASAPFNYPETVSRTHELGVVFKFKLTKNITPKVEYRLQQYDVKDFQMGAMTPYMGCIGTTSSPVTGCPSIPGSNIATNPLVSPFYPYFVVGDNSSARFLFMGADTPSYRVHMVSAGLVYHF